MAHRSRPTSQKRNKEKARQQKQKDKAARRLEAKAQKTWALPEYDPALSLFQSSGIMSALLNSPHGQKAPPGLPMSQCWT
jgi:hypothetical protein